MSRASLFHAIASFAVVALTIWTALQWLDVLAEFARLRGLS